ncbi:hypothetical protein DFJ74DRAFT_305830 [Hyaloraphidium curvatum]|nr:hypothetical protein DFJ74DRAFT_305830 [Hyaloraphidium curvatum]
MGRPRFPPLRRIFVPQARLGQGNGTVQRRPQRADRWWLLCSVPGDFHGPGPRDAALREVQGDEILLSGMPPEGLAEAQGEVCAEGRPVIRGGHRGCGEIPGLAVDFVDPARGAGNAVHALRRTVDRAEGSGVFVTVESVPGRGLSGEKSKLPITSMRSFRSHPTSDLPSRPGILQTVADTFCCKYGACGRADAHGLLAGRGSGTIGWRRRGGSRSSRGSGGRTTRTPEVGGGRGREGVSARRSGAGTQEKDNSHSNLCKSEGLHVTPEKAYQAVRHAGMTH